MVQLTHAAQRHEAARNMCKFASQKEAPQPKKKGCTSARVQEAPVSRGSGPLFCIPSYKLETRSDQSGTSKSWQYPECMYTEGEPVSYKISPLNPVVPVANTPVYVHFVSCACLPRPDSRVAL